MQNPFKHRPSDDFARRDPDDTRWEARDQRYDEGRSWSEGDGGRTYQAYGDQGRDTDRPYAGSRSYGYGQERQSDYGRTVSTNDRNSSPYDRPDYRSQSGYGRNASFGQHRYGGQDQYSQHGNYPSSNRGGYEQSDNRANWGGPDFGHSASRQDYTQNGYAPGAEIWRQDGGQSHQSRRDFEPDYLHWRDQQLSNFDRDYHDWRSERREKFSSDFDSWRQNRAANPIVGDVADGGVGDGREAKKS